jgi:hypothetical protein
MINRNQTRRIRSAIYTLKRLYGGTIYVYKKGLHATDITTGVKTSTGREVHKIDRAVIMPVKLERQQRQTTSIVASDSEFVYGGFFDSGARWFLIDPRDLPSGFEIDQDDYIIYNGKRYEIETIEDTEFDSLYRVLAKELIGVIPQQIHELTGKSLLDITQGGIHVL